MEQNFLVQSQRRRMACAYNMQYGKYFELHAHKCMISAIKFKAHVQIYCAEGEI